MTPARQMPAIVDFHGWRFRVETEVTVEAYASTTRRGAGDCLCSYCRNFIAQRAQEYPIELLTFLSRVGVDPYQEAEVWEAGPLEDDLSIYAGWWHFIANVETEGESSIPLDTNPKGLGKEWALTFLPGKRDLRIETLPVSPIVQVEFSVKLPWVLVERRGPR